MFYNVAILKHEILLLMGYNSVQEERLGIVSFDIDTRIVVSQSQLTIPSLSNLVQYWTLLEGKFHILR